MKKVKFLKKDRKGITLIALIITVIVMLILAGVAINLSIGDNGIFKKTQEVSEISKRASIKEELELKITDLEMEKLRGGSILTREDLVEKLPDMGVVVIEQTDTTIEGEYGDYQIIIDENRQVTVGAAGAKPTIEFSYTPTDEGVEKVELQVIASTTEGEIASIESLDGLIPKTENGNVYEITKNGEYKFKVTGDNGRVTIGKTTISNLLTTNESLFTVISEATQSGVMQVSIKGKTSGGEAKLETYSLNIIRHEGDMVLDGSKTYAGCTLANKVYEFGSTADVATASENATNTVVLKVEGDLTINSGVTLTAVKSAAGYGGPKGLIVYCTGTLTNNGIMSMTARGAKAEGQNVYLLKNANDTFEYIPAVGAAGGARVYAAGVRTDVNGKNGGKGSARALGGGGSGSCCAVAESNLPFSGAGGTATSYSGGPGGSACAIWYDYNGFRTYGTDASNSGGIGGNAEVGGVGGGAGNPSNGTGRFISGVWKECIRNRFL